jgi:tRNA pseudouridine-54 N-methylase
MVMAPVKISLGKSQTQSKSRLRELDNPFAAGRPHLICHLTRLELEIVTIFFLDLFFFRVMMETRDKRVLLLARGREFSAMAEKINSKR